MNLEPLAKRRHELSLEIASLKKEYEEVGKLIIDELKEPEHRAGKYLISYKIEPKKYNYDKREIWRIVDDGDTFLNLVEPVNEAVKNYFADDPVLLHELDLNRIPQGEKAVLRVGIFKIKRKPEKQLQEELINEIS